MVVINEYIALGVLALVFFLITERKRLNNIPIWTSILIRAGLMVGLQVISIENAFKAINLDVIIFLFGMFSIVSALDRSGVLKYVAGKMLIRANSNVNSILLVFVIGLGILSAFLVNDTIALLGIPLLSGCITAILFRFITSKNIIKMSQFIKKLSLNLELDPVLQANEDIATSYWKHPPPKCIFN